MGSNISIQGHIAAGMTYKDYYADKTIPKQHNIGLGCPKQFAGGLRVSTEAFYMKLKKKGKIPPDMTFRQWHTIITLSNQKLMDAVLTTELGIRLPTGMGVLRIEGRRPQVKPVYIFGKDGFTQTHNLHSFGYIYSMRWIKGPEVKMALKDIYHFQTTREIKETMCMQIKSEFPYVKNRYYEVRNK